MIFLFPPKYRRAFCAACCISALSAAALAGATRQDQSLNRIQDATKKSSEQGPPVRIPRQQAQTSAALDGIVRDAGVPGATRPVPAAFLTLRNVESGQIFSTTTSAEGVFRVFPLPPGHYQLRIEAKDYAVFVLPDLALQPNEVATLEISLVTTAAEEARSRLPRLPNLVLHFPPKCYAPSERIANFAIVSTQIRTTSKIFHLARCLRLPTSTTRFQTAGRLSSPITAAIRNTASTSTPSIVGTILSIAIASRVMSPSGPSCSANRFF